MTREDINRINSQYLNDCENTWEMEEIFALAIEALEQESILDKIRAKIERKLNAHGTVSLYNKAINDVLEILDKYKADKEQK